MDIGNVDLMRCKCSMSCRRGYQISFDNCSSCHVLEWKVGGGGKAEGWLVKSCEYKFGDNLAGRSIANDKTSRARESENESMMRMDVRW